MDIRDIQPIPAANPVINLTTFVLSQLENAWVKPSITVGSINNILSQKFRLRKPNKKNGKLI